MQRELSPGFKSYKEQKDYVQEKLYKPKIRQDRTAEEIEFEKNQAECSFSPNFYTKKNKRSSPVRGMQPRGQGS